MLPVLTVLALYGLAPQLLDVWEQAPRVHAIGWVGLAVMVGLETLSFAAVWELQRIAVPGLSWFAASTSQLTANAVSRAVPGGAAMGAGVSIRMWSIAGVEVGNAGIALAAISLISTGTLLALPLVSLVVALFGAPVPRNLTIVAVGGGLLAAALFTFGAVVILREQAAAALARAIARVTVRVARWFGRQGITPADLLQRRAALIGALGPRWKRALAASVANWGFDYGALVAALVFLDTNPRLSLVLVAYGASAALAMIPITPGGLGFVEAGLASLLVVAGVPASDALLATLAYRIVSYWLPLPAGLVAWLLFRRRYHQELDLEHLPAEPEPSITGPWPPPPPGPTPGR